MAPTITALLAWKCIMQWYKYSVFHVRRKKNSVREFLESFAKLNSTKYTFYR